MAEWVQQDLGEARHMGRGWRGRCAALSQIVATGLLASLLAAQLPALAAEDDEQPWYHVEVILFLNDTGLSDTDEVLTDDIKAHYPAAVLELGPPWGEPVRPRSTGELLALWGSVGQGPVVEVVLPGLNPELMGWLRWLDALLAGSEPRGLDVLEDIETLADEVMPLWMPAEPGSEPGLGPDGQPLMAGSKDPAAQPVELLPIELPPMQRRVFVPRRMQSPEALAEAALDIEIPAGFALRIVPTEERLLRAEMRRLSRSQGYQVLGWLSWRQPFQREAPALPVMVQWASADGTQRLDGSIGVDLRRFLHAAVDLYWQRPGEVDPGAPFLAPEPEVIHVRSSRRMRSGETHYVDHPRIGAIIRAEPFELTEPLEPRPSPRNGVGVNFY